MQWGRPGSLSDRRNARPLTDCFHNNAYANAARQKCLAARSPSRTVPETADTATILIRFCVATDSIDAAEDGNEFAFDFLRFGLCGFVFVDIAFPRWRAMRPDPDASLSGFVPDLQPPLHARGRESLRGLVNQSGPELMVYEFATRIAREAPKFLQYCWLYQAHGSVSARAGTAR